MRPTILSSIAITACCAALSGPPQQTQLEHRPRLDLKIATPEHTYESGSRIYVRAEIRNLGPEDVLIGWFFNDTLHLPTSLRIEVRDASGKKVSRSGPQVSIGPFAQHFGRDWWIQLRPWYFYGTDIPLDSAEWKFLLIPGRYKITAYYDFNGWDAGPPPEQKSATHEGRASPQPKLFRGKLESNSVWIEIVEQKKQEDHPH